MSYLDDRLYYLESQTLCWNQEDGVVLALSEMEIQHLINCKKKLEKDIKYVESYFYNKEEARPYIKRIRSKKREIEKEIKSRI